MNVKEGGAPQPPAGRRGGRQAERSEATRAALVAAARSLFAEHGFTGVGTEDIVKRAGVTRGALYHHFEGKADLFRAVYEDMERELVERIAVKAVGVDDPFEGLRVGADAFLDACLDPAIQRITLLDAPAVLGWEEWREIGFRHGVGLVQSTLQSAMDSGQLERQPVDVLAHLLIGSLDEAAMLVARADDVKATRALVGEAIARQLEGLRPRATRA